MVDCNQAQWFDYERGQWMYFTPSEKVLCARINEEATERAQKDASLHITIGGEYRAADTVVTNNLTALINGVNNTLMGWFSTTWSWMQGLVDREKVERQNADAANTAQTVALHNQQQTDIYNAVTASQQYTDNQVHTATVALSNQLSNNIQPLAQGIADNRSDLQRIHDQLKSFLDDPIAWILAVFSAVLVTFLTEEIADVIAPDTSVLPPRSDYHEVVKTALNW